MPLEAIFYVLKAAGAVCVLCGCAGMGMAMCTGLNRRLLALQELQQLVMKMAGEIRCMAEPLPQVLEHISHSAGPVYREFFTDVCTMLRDGHGRTFCVVWEQNVDRHFKGGVLKPSDTRLIRELGAMLGSHDGKMQLSVLELFAGRVQAAIDELSKNLEGQKRVYGSLWVLGGIFLVIVFI